MADATFRAEVLTESGTRENGKRFILTFAAANGDKQTVSLPISVLAQLGPVIADVAQTIELAIGGPGFSKRITSWQVGRSNETPEVTLKFGEIAYSISVDEAKSMWRQIREETDAIARRGPTSRH